MKRLTCGTLVFSLVLTLSLAVAPALAATAAGLDVAESQGCKGCHQIQGKGGSLGPTLDGIGKRMDAPQLRLQLDNPKAIKPDSIMPAYDHLSDADKTALIDFLLQL